MGGAAGLRDAGAAGGRAVAWHLNTTNGLSTLVSSKVNQWTLLVGTLPLVFAVAAGTATGLPVGPASAKSCC